jgi:MFS family permease
LNNLSFYSRHFLPNGQKNLLLCRHPDDKLSNRQEKLDRLPNFSKKSPTSLRKIKLEEKMKTRLQPMGARDILDNTFSILRERFWTFQGVILLSFLPSLLFLLIGAIYITIVLLTFPPGFFSGFFPGRPDFWSEIFGRFGTSGLIFLVSLLIIWIISLIAGGIFNTHGNIRIFQLGLHQESCTVKEAFRGLKAKWLWYFLFGILAFVISLVVSIPGYYLAISLRSSGSVLLQNTADLMVSILQIAAGFFICLTPVVIAVEETDAVKALIRGFSLLKNYRLKVLGVLILVYLLGYALLIIMFGISVIPITLVVRLPNPVTFTVAAILLLGACLICNVMISYFFGPLTAIYYDLIIRKEGYDLQLEAEENPTGASGFPSTGPEPPG